MNFNVQEVAMGESVSAVAESIGCEGGGSWDDPTVGSFYSLLNLAEHLHSELQAAINGRQW